jgi:sec-independent protein translocase protein TatC
MSDPAEEPGELAEGTLISHLLELRDRIMKAMIAVFICFIPCAIYMNQLFTFVAQPLIHKLPMGSTMIATSVVAPFMVPFKLAFVVAFGSRYPSCCTKPGRSSRRGCTGTRRSSRSRC